MQIHQNTISNPLFSRPVVFSIKIMKKWFQDTPHSRSFLCQFGYIIQANLWPISRILSSIPVKVVNTQAIRIMDVGLLHNKGSQKKKEDIQLGLCLSSCCDTQRGRYPVFFRKSLNQLVLRSWIQFLSVGKVGLRMDIHVIIQNCWYNLFQNPPTQQNKEKKN